jgi:predicted dithiol-disulfide oxidoreductase (DUF899 family)
MQNHQVVSHEDWLAARQVHLAKEKAFTRLRDELSAERRSLPWERVEKEYVFDSPNGQQSLVDLFAGKQQLVVYHFMFGPDWEEGCPSCSFWADNFNGIGVHLQHRDTTLVAVSRAPIERLVAYRQRMGWSFPWFSSLHNDFNFDYQVSFLPDPAKQGEYIYNYRKGEFGGEESPGISVFYRNDDGAIYHTYSTYGRGLDMMNAAYHYLDLTPKGRDEEQLEWPMAWLRRHDTYDLAAN